MIHTDMRVDIFLSSVSYVQATELYRMIVQVMRVDIFESYVSYEPTTEFYRMSHPELRGDICLLSVLNAWATELY